MNERLEGIIKGLPFTLTEEQDFFIRDFVKGNGHCSLVGDGGTGKSTVMWILAKYYGSEIIFGGSSGVATVNLPDNIGIATGHKIFNLSVGEAIPKDYKRSAIRALTSSDTIKVIVLDEAFCYNSQDLDQILNQIRKLNKRTSKRGARNIRLLLVGDCLQRLPIVEDDLKKKLIDKYGHYLMFRSYLWKQFNFTNYVFQEVKRQAGETPKDVWFKKALYVIRYGMEQHYDTVLKGLNKLVVGDNYEKGSIYIAPTNALVDEYNNNYLQENPNPKLTFRVEFGDGYEKKDFPMEWEVTLAEGCKCICLVNDSEGAYQNGTEITVTTILVGEGIYGTKDDGREIFVPIHEFKQEDIEFTEVASSDLSDLDIESALRKVLSDEDMQGVKTRKDLEKLYEVHVTDKVKHQDRIHIASAYMLPVKLSSGYVVSRCQGKTFDRKGVIDVGDPSKDYFYTWNKMPDYMVAGLFVALGRFTSIDHIQLKRPIEKKHIKVCRDSINYWWECVAEFNERREQ